MNSTLLEDSPLSGVLSLDQILPSQRDLDIILEEYQVFVSRYKIENIISITNLFNIFRLLVRNVSKFSEDKASVTWHIPSTYSDQLSTQSVVVSV